MITILPRIRQQVPFQVVRACIPTRKLGNIHVPFQDDLNSMEDDDLNLSDFQHYRESPNVIAKKSQLLHQNVSSSSEEIDSGVRSPTKKSSLTEFTKLEEPVVFVSKLNNPYLNLAIEDFIYHEMPKPETTNTNYNRLMFYTNSPCVVIGKNQNPWKEVNLPVLNSLTIPLVRRRSGGGTVVHDLGNVNYSFMTTKEKFDRFTFANMVRDSLNSIPDSKYVIEVNDRGDITTTKQDDGINYKVSGSAYKLSKGKSYHHGTMLLNSRLDVLGKLLHRDESKLGMVESTNSIESVKSKVTNLEISEEQFINMVADRFRQEFGNEIIASDDKLSKEEFDQDELFGLTDFVEANQVDKTAKIILIDEDMELPQQVLDTSKELKQWSWRFGSTPKFSHELTNTKFGFKIKFHVGKHGIVTSYDLSFFDIEMRLLSVEKTKQSFEFLEMHIKNNELQYTGSNVAGFITNDMISDWVGQCIDGTI